MIGAHIRASGLPVSLRFALREMRAGLKGFRIFITCLLLGVATLAGVGSLSQSLMMGLKEEGQALLGGDIEVRSRNIAIDDETRRWMQSTGILSDVVRLRVMAKGKVSDRRTLVELKAVDNLYPLYGTLGLEPEMPVSDIFKDNGAAIPQELADRLGTGVGETISIGGTDFEVRTILTVEPDKANEGLQWGPTIMVSHEGLAATGLLQIGSLVSYRYRMKLDPETDLEAWRTTFEENHDGTRWGLRSRDNAAPGIRRFIDRMGMFLTLVGLTALVVGGVGIGNAVKTYLDAKTGTIATYKILGAESATVFRTYLAQILLLATLAIIAGLGVGALFPPVLTGLLADKLPIPPKAGFFPDALAIAALYGYLITIAFALWPLARAKQVPAARLFRALVAPEAGWPERRYLAIIALAISAVIALAILTSPLPQLSAGFVVAAAFSLVLLRATGWAIMALSRRVPRPRHALMRLALVNLHRPGAATGAVVLSLGLGLTLFSALALIEGNLERQIANEIPDAAPSFFFIDIQKHQEADFRATALGEDGVTSLRMVPTLRGPVTRVNGVPAAEVQAGPGGSWILNGDRGLTFFRDLPEGNVITAGEWWPSDYAGPALISLDAGVGKSLGLDIGDTLTMGVFGREIEATIASFREINWGTMGFNFGIIFAPGALDAAPYTLMASLVADDDAESRVHRTLTDKFPTVTTLRVKEVLSTVSKLLEDMATAIRVTALIAIVSGVVVLAGAIAAGHRARVYDAVILKVLGAVRRDVMTAFVLEFLALGLITGVIALGLGLGAGYVVIVNVMEADFVAMPVPMILTILASMVVTLGFGMAGTWAALGAKPNRVLREL